MWTHHVFLSKRIKGKKTLPSFYASVYTTNNYYNFKEKQQKQAVISVKILYYYEKRLENKI